MAYSVSMKNNRPFCAFLFLLSFTTMAYAEPPQQPHDNSFGFHRAQMPIEQSLDAILTQAAASETLFCAILPKRCTPSPADLVHVTVYSARLLSSIRKTEQKLLNRECNGIYRDHELCGIDYDPILCGQENSRNGYLYKIPHEDAGTAEILSIWADSPIDPSHPTRYFLIKEKGVWKLDGVDCELGQQFNIKPR